MRIAATPSVSKLRDIVRSKHWEVIHVTGVDTHQAVSLVENFYEGLEVSPATWEKIEDQEGQIRDGMILRESRYKELPVAYTELAKLLVNPDKAPYLVTLNLYHSGARIARELVKDGAHAAIGFLDEIDDELAELFFQAFYWAWCRPGGAFSVPHAFVEAWKNLQGHGDRP